MGYWRVVGVISLWQVAASICYYSVFAATTFFRGEFGLSRFSVGLVVTALTLGYAVFLLPLGAFTDRYGERRTLTAGLCCLSIGALLVTGAWSYPTLLIAAFLLGSTYGVAMPGTNKAIFDGVASERQNLAVGIKQVGVTAGSGISALLVTGLAGVLYWEAGFYVAAGFGLLSALVFAVVYRSDGGGGAASYPDFRGLVRNRPYRSLTVAGFFLGSMLFTTVGYTILFVEESVNTTAAVGGVVLALLQVSGSVGRVVSGWLSDVVPGDPRRSIGSILLVQTLGAAILFVAVTFVDSTLGAVGGFVGLGFFALGFTGVYYSCMATVVSADEMGGATAGGQLALTSGALVAPPAFGYLADVASYRASWLLLAVFGVIAAVLVVRVIRTPPSEVDGELAVADAN